MADYKYLVEKFTKEKIKSRYDWLNKSLELYIQKRNYQDKVVISQDILKHVIVDYFVDIDRLKEFQEIELVHTSKIYAYLCFWILRHKPIQLINKEGLGDLAFINEKFVCTFLRSYLFSEFEGTVLFDTKRNEVDNFVDTLLYYFQYRDYSAKTIELIILSFQAGCAYQYCSEHQ